MRIHSLSRKDDDVDDDEDVGNGLVLDNTQARELPRVFSVFCRVLSQQRTVLGTTLLAFRLRPDRRHVLRARRVDHLRGIKPTRCHKAFYEHRIRVCAVENIQTQTRRVRRAYGAQTQTSSS